MCGVAVLINAYNFPCWGMLEKLAPTLLAGVPAIVKPASSTAYLTELMVRHIIKSGLLPDGALQLICGGVGDLFDHLNCQDIVAFTGSKGTADFLSQHKNVVDQSIRFTAETDSLNCSILGPDAKPGTPEFDLYVNEIVSEISSKAGQKCTAIRRIIVPAELTGDLVSTLSDRLGKLRLGNPARLPSPMRASAAASSRLSYGSTVATGPNASTLCGVFAFNGSSHCNNIGAKNAPLLASPSITSKSSMLP